MAPLAYELLRFHGDLIGLMGTFQNFLKFDSFWLRKNISEEEEGL